MYEAIINLSKKIISESYNIDSKIDKDILLIEMKTKLNQLLQTGNASDKSQAIELYKFFVTLQLDDKNLQTALKTNVINVDYNKIFENKINHLASIKNFEVAKLLFLEYLTISTKCIKKRQMIPSNAYNILPRSRFHFIDALYAYVTKEDNVAFFKFLNTEIHPLKPEQLLLRLQHIVIRNKSQILDYLLDILDIVQINDALQVDKYVILTKANFSNKRNIIEKVLAKNPSPEIKEGILRRLSSMRFNDELNELMQIMFSNGVDVNYVYERGYSRLANAIVDYNASEDWIKCLLKNGADINYQHRETLFTPTHLAIHTNQPAKLQILLEHKANTEITSKQGITPLILSILLKSLTFTMMLLQNGADVNNQGTYSFAPIDLAAQLADSDIFRFLVKNNADLTREDKLGNSVLHKAVASHSLSKVRLLIEKKVNINKLNHADISPLTCAIKNNDVPIIKYLLNNGAQLDISNKVSFNSFQWALLKADSIATLTLLQRKGANVKALDPCLNNALHTVSLSESANFVPWLFEQGVDVEATNISNLTPLQFAIVNGSLDVFNQLIEIKANTAVLTPLGDNLIHLAVGFGRYEFLQILVNKGVDINSTSNNRVLSPFALAIFYNNLKMCKILTALGAKLDYTDPETAILIKEADNPLKTYLASLIETNVNSNFLVADTNPLLSVATNYTLAAAPINYPSYKKVNSKHDQPQVTKKQAHNKISTGKKDKNIDTKNLSMTRTTNKSSEYTSVQNTQQANADRKLAAKNRIKTEEEQNLKLEKERKEIVAQKIIKQQKEKELLKSSCTLLDEILATQSTSAINDVADIKLETKRIDALKTLISQRLYSSKFFVLQRSVALDHQSGRPCVIVHRTDDRCTVIIGSSSAPKQQCNLKFVAIKLSETDERLTYFAEVKFNIAYSDIKNKWKADYDLCAEDWKLMIDLFTIAQLEQLVSIILTNTKNNAQNFLSPTANYLLTEETNETLAITDNEKHSTTHKEQKSVSLLDCETYLGDISSHQ